VADRNIAEARAKRLEGLARAAADAICEHTGVKLYPEGKQNEALLKAVWDIEEALKEGGGG
jgi:hypothetical protein